MGTNTINKNSRWRREIKDYSSNNDSVPTTTTISKKSSIYYSNSKNSSSDSNKEEEESIKINFHSQNGRDNYGSRGKEEEDTSFPRLHLNVLYNKLLNKMTHLKVSLLAIFAFFLVATTFLTSCSALTTTNATIEHQSIFNPITRSGADLSLVSPGDLLLSLATESTSNIRRQQQVSALQKYSDSVTTESSLLGKVSRRSPDRLVRRQAPEPIAAGGESATGSGTKVAPGERQVVVDEVKVSKNLGEEASEGKSAPVYVSAPKQIQEPAVDSVSLTNKPAPSLSKARGSYVNHHSDGGGGNMKRAAARHMEASKKKKKKMKKKEKKIKKHKKVKKMKKKKKMKKSKKVKKMKKEKKFKKHKKSMKKKKKKKKKSATKKQVKKVLYKKEVKKVKKVKKVEKKKEEKKKKQVVEKQVHYHEPQQHYEEEPKHENYGHKQQEAAGHKELGKYYEYRSVPKKGAWDFGYKRGNSKHQIERKEHGHKSHFKTEVKWKDKKGKGHHLFDYNHFDKHHKKGYHVEAKKPKKKKKASSAAAAAASIQQPMTQSNGNGNLLLRPW